MEALKERKDMDSQYMWDLTPLYESDEKWEEDLNKLDETVSTLASYQGKLKDASTIHSFLVLETELNRKLEDVFCYASLRRSEDTRAKEAQQMYSKAMGKYVTIVSTLAFAEPEILSLSEEELESISKDPCMKDYAYAFEQLLNKKPYMLSSSEEALLARFGEVISAPGQIADNLQDADLVFDSVKDGEGKEVELSGSNYISLQSSTDRELRKNSFESYYKTYKEHINTFAATYSANVKAAVTEASVRKYNSSREMSLSENHIPLSVYDNLIEAVHKYMPLMYRYEKLRKEILGLDELHYYDLYAPLVKGNSTRYTYEEAQQMVLDAVKPLGENYNEIVKSAFKERWIDVYPNKGKSGGAYSSGTYDSRPYIMTNFTGTLDSVSTIAHEMGHSLHTWHSNHTQPAQYASYTLFVAEVASTVNENLLIEQLLDKTSDPVQRLSYLNQYLEGFKGTVYRQTMFAEFEKEAHAMAERGEPLDPSSLNDLYARLIKLYFGDELVMDEEVQYEWARIPHFYRPFYVYVYATGYSTAVALSEGILNEKDPAVKRYIEFLSMGGSAYPLDELKHAGVDLTTPEPIETALKKFEKVLNDAEETFSKIK
jgi:oligoendopeptidase F